MAFGASEATGDSMLEPSVTPRGEGAIDFHLGNTLVASYHYGHELARPHLAPLIGPGGRQVTADPGPVDHPHHRGVWTGHRDVARVDHWTEFAGHGRIVHEAFDELGPAIRERLSWLDPDGGVALSEERLIRLHRGPDVTLDYGVRLTASGRAVVLGRQKDAAMLAVRVAPGMETIENETGARGEAACYGRRSAWCDMSGPVDGTTVGVAVLDHPDNPWSPAPWHVREYGLMAPNPFLEAAMTLEAEQAVTFRYRLAVHAGDAGAARIADRQREFAQGA